MCPFCLSTIALVVAGAVSTSGLTALAVKVSRKKKKVKEITPNSSESNTTGQDSPIGLAGIATNRMMADGDESI